jgi:hypothetical protein
MFFIPYVTASMKLLLLTPRRLGEFPDQLRFRKAKKESLEFSFHSGGEFGKREIEGCLSRLRPPPSRLLSLFLKISLCCRQLVCFKTFDLVGF